MELGALASITQVVTLLALLSVAGERVVGIASVFLKIDSFITNSKFNGAAKQILAAIIGAGIYMLNTDSHLALIDQYFSGFIGPVVVGLLASGGSGFWNSILKSISLKNEKLKE